jgi:hypothetical protein
MLEDIAAAIERRDYQTATRLLKPFLEQNPDNLWGKFYRGRLLEAAGKARAAETVYRDLLRQTTNTKLVSQIRQSLQRLEEDARARRQEAIAQATENPDNTKTGFLILASTPSEQRSALIPEFARIMKLDAYTARIHLSHRGWKLYRTGAVGEIQVYGQELQAAGIPVFWQSLAEIKALRVFRVQYLQAAVPQPAVVCLNEQDQVGTLAFSWQEVQDRVIGALPLFEDVVDVGPWNQLKRREETQDYVQMMDLHLPARKCILRFCDRSYQFHHGVEFAPGAVEDNPLSQSSNRIKWNRMVSFFRTALPHSQEWSEFTPFAETALDHLDLIYDLKSHIDLFRKEPTNWDPAFQLYSGLVFLKQNALS